jgi:hypothetical protein
MHSSMLSRATDDLPHLWANPVEAHLGPLRQFTIANSHHRNPDASPTTAAEPDHRTHPRLRAGTGLRCDRP